MDATKAAAWLAANNITDGYKLFTGLRHRALPFALAGTTAGTGSEVSATAVITLDREKRKKSVNDPQCYARVAFCDPRYTHTMSRANHDFPPRWTPCPTRWRDGSLPPAAMWSPPVGKRRCR